MTREEMEELKGLAASMGLYDDKNPCKRAVILGKAIKALEQEPYNDAISRQAVLDYCYQLINVEHQQGSDEMNYGQERVAQTETILHHLEFMPSITPQPKMGRWIEERNDYEEITRWHCSRCYDDSGFTTTCKWDYCPNCGAKIEVSE